MIVDTRIRASTLEKNVKINKRRQRLLGTLQVHIVCIRFLM